MPDTLTFSLKQLVRVCLNDPLLRNQIHNALAEGPLAIRTPCVYVRHDDQAWAAFVQTNREKAPGEPGFIASDDIGWIVSRLSMIMAAPNAATMTVDDVADQLAVDATKPKPDST
jgi:hypothetical protein